MNRLISALALLLGLFVLAVPASAEPEDIEAAARGVVRVIVVGREGNEVFPLSHGSGFAVDSETIVTNAHVVSEAARDTRLAIGIVPSDGNGGAIYGRVISISPRNDLALVRTTSPMHLSPLTLAGNPPANAGTVFAIGFPMNVDQAQGLGTDDIFRAQPPVTSQGYLSGRRPSRDFDTLLHTAPIARGNSGGPLVDDCGRVVGVNSFGAESEGTEAEFFFSVTMRELLPFLRANNVTPRVNSLPCRSLAELDAAERERVQRQQMSAQMEAEAAEQAQALRREELRRDIEFTVLDERMNRMGIALLLFVVFMGAGLFAGHAHMQQDMRQRSIAGAVAVAALLGSVIALLSRPAFADVEERLEDQLREEMTTEDSGPIAVASSTGIYSCTLDTSRSRVVSAPTETLELDWTAEGCVNQRTQYGESAGQWSRVLVPAEEAAVSVNRFDPASGEYVVDRYLLDSAAMSSAREARAAFEAPACGAGSDAARQLGEQQRTIMTLLPDRPNERLVYNCSLSGNGSEAAAE